MSKVTGYSLPYCGIVTIVFISVVCDSAVLIRTSDVQPKSLDEVLSESYQVSSKRTTIVSHDVCIIQNITEHSHPQIKSINCTDVTGVPFPAELTNDKFLHLGYNNRYIAPGEYCITKRNVAKLCPMASSFPSQFTWRKCCPQNQLVNSQNSCTISSVLFRLLVNKTNPSFSVVNSYKVDFGCPAGHSLKKFSTSACASQSMTRFRVSSNGTIEYELSVGVFLRKSEWKSVDPSSNLYCLDGVSNPTLDCNNANDASSRRFAQPLQQQRFLENNVKVNKAKLKWDDDDNDNGYGRSSFISKCGNTDGVNQQPEMTTVLFVCVREDHISAPETSTENVSYQTTFFAIIWLLTCPLLLCAAVGNCCIIQKNVHGCILTCYLLSMFVLNVLSVIFILNVRDQEKEKGCKPLDFMIKFMYMSTLCWISSINFGLHKTFRYTLPEPVGYRRFITSVIFSLGFPAISLTVCYNVAIHTLNARCGGLGYCVLYHPVTIPFYSVPMLLLVVGNFAIFLKTSFTIARLRKEAEDVLQRQAEDHLKSFGLFAKLFLLSGGIWLVRVLLFILQIKGMYLTWYGVILETAFSVPEVVFPMVVFHHPEFIKWSWNTAPVVSGIIFKFNPLFHVPTNK